MVGEFTQKFLWRVLIAHLAFLAVFIFAVRMAHGETKVPRSTAVAIFPAHLQMSAAPAGTLR